MESAATSVARYQGEFVPGLLQTADYARAVLRAMQVTATDEEIEQRVKVRMARQEGLTGPDAPQLWVVLNEAVLGRQVGGHAVMREQLLKIAEVSEAGNVTVQVLPFRAGAHPAMDSPFALLGFAEVGAAEVVYLEYPTGALYLEREAEVARYRVFFDHLRAASLSVSDSRRLVVSVADELA